MKRYIQSDARLNALKQIEVDARNQGLNAKINKETGCVDIFDRDGNVIEQR